MKDNHFTCDHCGEQYPLAHQYEIGEDRICSDCADELTVVCECCGTRIYSADEAGDENHTLCESCRENEYRACSRCGHLIPESDACYLEDDHHEEEPLCDHCYDICAEDALIHAYDYVPDLNFHGKGLRHFGVELEIDSGGKDVKHAKQLLAAANNEAENLYIKSDGSLDDGLELVTHPMTLDYHLNTMPWEEVLCKAKELGYLSHRAETCGLHVHVSRLAFGCTYDHQEAAIARLLFFVEKFWPEMLRFSRRTEGQLNRWAARYGMKLCPKEVLHHAKNSCAGRYTAVNLTRSDTIEIRIFRGTLKLNTLIATLQMVNHLCEVAISLSDEELQQLSWYDFLELIHDPELIVYLKERRLYVNEPIVMEEDE